MIAWALAFAGELRSSPQNVTGMITLVKRHQAPNVAAAGNQQLSGNETLLAWYDCENPGPMRLRSVTHG